MKTKVILYTPRAKKLATDKNLCLGCQQLKMVHSVDILGIHFSKHLTWNEHVDYLQSKQSSPIGVIERTRRILPAKVKVVFYSALGVL